MCKLDGIMPLFIVSDLQRTIAFYCRVLGFELRMSLPGTDPFFAIVVRDSVSIMLKYIGPELVPEPNVQRHAWVKWDAFISTSDPHSLARKCGASFEVHDTEDGLRGFEVADPDGYMLFFGHPL